MAIAKYSVTSNRVPFASYLLETIYRYVFHSVQSSVKYLKNYSFAVGEPPVAIQNTFRYLGLYTHLIVYNNYLVNLLFYVTWNFVSCETFFLVFI
jgi:hypothetical protein